MMDWQDQLINRIDKLLDGTYSVDEFREHYYFFFLDDVPDEALNDEELEFFSDIQEKLDWTDKNPDDESRSFGWINNEEYIQWLKDYKLKYFSKN